MKKKLLALLLVTTLIGSLVGCGTNTSNKTVTPTTSASDVSGNNSSNKEESNTANDNSIIATDEQGNIVIDGNKSSTDDNSSIEPGSNSSSEDKNSENNTVDASKPEGTTTSTAKPEEETTKAKYTYKDLSATMYAKSTVNVRSLPSTDGERLGSLSSGKETKVTGQCNETGWYRIDYNGQVAYVSNDYLVTNKPATSTTAPTTKPANKPAEQTTTKPSSSNSSWAPTYYTANDRVGDGLDAYRVGLQKYASDGTQLYVATNYTDNENGYFYVNESKYSAKNEAFKEAFLEVYDPPYTAEYGRPDMYGLCNTKVDNTNYGKMAWSYSTKASNMAPGYNATVLYVWDEVRLILVYGSAMPMYASGMCKLSFNVNTLEDTVKAMGYTMEQYNAGEKLAKKYGLDYHGNIEYYKEMMQ